MCVCDFRERERERERERVLGPHPSCLSPVYTIAHPPTELEILREVHLLRPADRDRARREDGDSAGAERRLDVERLLDVRHLPERLSGREGKGNSSGCNSRSLPLVSMEARAPTFILATMFAAPWCCSPSTVNSELSCCSGSGGRAGVSILARASGQGGAALMCVHRVNPPKTHVRKDQRAHRRSCRRDCNSAR